MTSFAGSRIRHMNNEYTALIQKDGRWWVGWLEEIPGVNGQGESREELMDNLRSALTEALEMNRADARRAAGDEYEEVRVEACNAGHFSRIYAGKDVR